MTEQTPEYAWVYGIVPAGRRLEELDRRRERLPADVRVLVVGDLGVIVGDPPGPDAKATRDRAVAHARVLEAAVVDVPVVPARFGTVLASDGVHALIEGRHDELAQLLASVSGQVQFTLKVNYHEDAVLREIVTSRPEIACLREQTRAFDEFATRDLRVRLGELVSSALDQTRQRDAGAIGLRLNPCCVAFTFEPLEREFMVLKAPFLVERAKMQVFEKTVAGVAAEHAERMHFVLLGPMPAYSFVSGGSAAWE